MPTLTSGQLSVAFAVVAGVAVVALLLAIGALVRLRRLRRHYSVLRGNEGEADIVALVRKWMQRLNHAERRLDELAAIQHEQASSGRLAIQRFSVVRYDAFEDMGGRLSFSAAFLDGHGDGVVISSINGRTETRTYAKLIKGLRSEHNLSEEEREAIARAASREQRTEGRAALSR
jgi:Protein of unknown function (DUF4446)